jgi:cobalamin biosynthesis protein CbiG
MITPASATPRDLIGLAERMGVPREDAVCLVLKHLTDQQLSADAVEAGRSIRRMKDHDDVDDRSRARLDAAVVAAGQRPRHASNGVVFVA